MEWATATEKKLSFVCQRYGSFHLIFAVADINFPSYTKVCMYYETEKEREREIEKWRIQRGSEFKIKKYSTINLCTRN